MFQTLCTETLKTQTPPLAHRELKHLLMQMQQTLDFSPFIVIGVHNNHLTYLMTDVVSVME